MASTEYRDVLWHFSSDKSSRKLRDGHFLLHIFTSEEELFEADQQLEHTSAGIPIQLPSKKLLDTTKYSTKRASQTVRYGHG